MLVEVFDTCGAVGAVTHGRSARIGHRAQRFEQRLKRLGPSRFHLRLNSHNFNHLRISINSCLYGRFDSISNRPLSATLKWSCIVANFSGSKKMLTKIQLMNRVASLPFAMLPSGITYGDEKQRESVIHVPIWGIAEREKERRIV